MKDVVIGQEIGVRGDVNPGPFGDEYLVTIETISGPISGFVPERDVKNVHNGEGLVRAIVKAIDTNVITVWISGSFFTTTGLAQIPPHIAAAALN